MGRTLDEVKNSTLFDNDWDTSRSTSGLSDEYSIMGGSLFPMLYVYYKGGKGTPKNKFATRAKDDMLNLGIQVALLSHVNSELGTSYESRDLSEGTMPEEAIVALKEAQNNYDAQLPKIYRLMLSAIEQNRQYLTNLGNYTTGLKNQHDRLLPKQKQNHGYYVAEAKTAAGKTQCDYYPIIDTQNDPGVLGQIMETLRLLYEHGLIDIDHQFGIRQLNIVTGTFADDVGDFVLEKNTARILGYPTRGRFILNDRPQETMMYHTFNGTNVKTMAILGNHIQELNGLVSLSWSIHRSKQAVRTTGKTAQNGTAKGSRTIAGSLVFTMTDHHPLLDLLPGTIPEINPAGTNAQRRQWTPSMLSDEFPPFDLNIIIMNEYGHATMLTIYGLEISDEGGVLSTDNVLSELVMQYTAMSMDPIIQVKPDENGNYDFGAIYSNEFVDLWRNREKVAKGAHHTELSEQYDLWYDSIQQPWMDEMARQKGNVKDKTKINH